jgi:hypothetical protein
MVATGQQIRQNHSVAFACKVERQSTIANARTMRSFPLRGRGRGRGTRGTLLASPTLRWVPITVRHVTITSTFFLFARAALSRRM